MQTDNGKKKKKKVLEFQETSAISIKNIRMQIIKFHQQNSIG